MRTPRRAFPTALRQFFTALFWLTGNVLIKPGAATQREILRWRLQLPHASPSPGPCKLLGDRPASVAGRLLLAWTLTSLVLRVSLSADSGAKPGFWIDVPFVRQAKNLCGAASVSMVLQYWHKASPAGGSIEVPFFSRHCRGSRFVGIEGRTRQPDERLSGLDWVSGLCFQGSLGGYRSHISKGRPLIAALGNRGALDHYVVVTGWNNPENVVLVNDPAQT